jgi:hypothetical protein
MISTTRPKETYGSLKHALCSVSVPARRANPRHLYVVGFSDSLTGALKSIRVRLKRCYGYGLVASVGLTSVRWKRGALRVLRRSRRSRSRVDAAPPRLLCAGQCEWATGQRRRQEAKAKAIHCIPQQAGERGGKGERDAQRTAHSSARSCLQHAAHSSILIPACSCMASALAVLHRRRAKALGCPQPAGLAGPRACGA